MDSRLVPCMAITGGLRWWLALKTLIEAGKYKFPNGHQAPLLVRRVMPEAHHLLEVGGRLKTMVGMSVGLEDPSSKTITAP